MIAQFFSSFDKIVLVAGHGGGDSGALSPQGHKESEQNIFIVDKVANYLKQKKLNILVCPHNFDLQQSINWINANFSPYNSKRKDNAWVIEFHRDFNNPNLPLEQRNDQVGVYYFDEDRNRKESAGDGFSLEIAKKLIEVFLRLGAYKGDVDIFNFNGSWAKDHYLDWAGYYLGFIELTKPLAHIIELGFMSGRNDEKHLEKLAKWAAIAIYETFTGLKFEEKQDFNTFLAQTYMHNLENLRNGQGKIWWQRLPEDMKRAMDSSFDPCFVAMKYCELLDRQKT